MKVSRIYPYIKTKGEVAHEQMVTRTKGKGFKHSGSKSFATLKQDNKSYRAGMSAFVKDIVNKINAQ